MAKNNNEYTQLCAELKEKITANNRAKGRTSSAVSRSDLEAMTTALLNSPDHEVTVYSYSAKDTSGTGEPLGVIKKPVRRYRDALKRMVINELNVDKHDAAKLDDIVITKEHAASMMEVSTQAIHDYINIGRKFSFPITTPDETRMEFASERAPERTSVGNRFKKDVVDMDDTITTTKERTVIKAKNSVPFWLKETNK